MSYQNQTEKTNSIKIFLRDSREFKELQVTLHQIEDWDYIVPSPSSGGSADYSHNYWLGSSRDVQVWFLAITIDGSDNIDLSKDVVTILTHPPKPDVNTIGEILIKAYSMSIQEGGLSSSRIKEIVASVPFPEYLSVRSLMPEAPEAWLDLPCELSVNFSLSDGACVYRDLFDEYSRTTIRDTLRVVCGPRHDGILIHYHLAARETIPFLLWDIDWPLLRRGKESTSKREKVQKNVPWKTEADRTLIEIYQHLGSSSIWRSSPYFGEPSVRLRVGGRTPEEAVRNWHQCAQVIRKIRESIMAKSSIDSSAQELSSRAEAIALATQSETIQTKSMAGAIEEALQKWMPLDESGSHTGGDLSLPSSKKQAAKKKTGKINDTHKGGNP
jgi:hypothetical protein